MDVCALGFPRVHAQRHGSLYPADADGFGYARVPSEAPLARCHRQMKKQLRAISEIYGEPAIKLRCQRPIPASGPGARAPKPEAACSTPSNKVRGAGQFERADES